MMKHRTLRASFTAAASLAAVAMFATAQQADTKPATTGDAITVYSGGLEGLLVDPKDKVLVDAIRFMDQRVAELPNETGEHDMPAPALRLAMELLMGPMEFRAGMLDEMPEGDAPPFYGQFNFITKDQQAAEALAGRFLGALTMPGAVPPGAIQPAPDAPGMQMMNLDGPNAYFGAMKREGAPAFTIALSKLSTTPVHHEGMAAARGVKPALAMSMNFRNLQSFFDMALAHEHDAAEAEMIKGHLHSMGLYGPNALLINAAMSHEADRTRAEVRFSGLAKTLREMNTLPSKRLTAADLKRIPADATMAQVAAFDFNSFQAMIERAMPKSEDAPPDPMAMIEQATGIHPQRDLFAHLGQTVGCYASDTTGGGGLLSMVLFVEVKNSDGLNQTLTRLTAMINQMAQQAARGYVRLAERTVRDQKMHVLSFPGVPIPVEISFTIADGYLYAAASPQALLAAIQQGKGSAGGLADHPRFKEMGGSDLNNAYKVCFIDTPRMMRSGYGLVSLGVSALCNVVRSPTDPNRGSNLLMPSLAELSNGAKATVSISRIEGDDIVATAQMDRSFLVNACGAVGALGGTTGILTVASLGSGILMPALGKARETAKETKSMAQLRQISMAVMTYASEHDDAVPTSVQPLLELTYITEEILRSPVGSIHDEHGDYFLNLAVGGGKMSDIKNPAQHVLGYDRAMLANTGKTAVVFFDGHVEMLDGAQLMELASNADHHGVDFKLPE